MPVCKSHASRLINNPRRWRQHHLGVRFADAPRATNTVRFLRVRQAMQLTGVARMTIYRL